ncbi:unnamed protein product [Lactuca virosa]|uniref:RRM domain-containing protein n=1 Tax=Lactuca virosa TaxID=75947 RepID=A0AAU9M7A9_9ASTR|nr:unnamed protein product [Lactuca virosa]
MWKRTGMGLGSLASSAVVNDVYNFTEFDQHVGDSAGPEYKAVLQEVSQLVEEKLASNSKALKTTFGATQLKIDGDFLYFLAEAASIAFQYGNPDKLCTPMTEAKKAGEDLVAKPCKSLWVSGISSSTTKEDLEEEISKFGKFEDFKFLRDKNTAYIDYSKLEDASKALKMMHGKKRGGSVIRVDYLRSQPKRDQVLISVMQR